MTKKVKKEVIEKRNLFGIMQFTLLGLFHCLQYFYGSKIAQTN